MNVLSWALWGVDARYHRGVPVALVGRETMFKSWMARIALHDSALDGPGGRLLRRLEGLKGLDLRGLPRPARGRTLTLWRLRPLWEDDVTVSMGRDLDCVPTMVEARAAALFLEGSWPALSVRPHNYLVPYMGGLSAFRAAEAREVLPEYDELERMGYAIPETCNWEGRNADEWVMARALLSHLGCRTLHVGPPVCRRPLIQWRPAVTIPPRALPRVDGVVDLGFKDGDLGQIVEVGPQRLAQVLQTPCSASEAVTRVLRDNRELGRFYLDN